MSLGTILLIIVVLMLVGIIPAWPHSRSWGYGPSGIVGVILVVALIITLVNNQGDDGSTPATDAPVTTLDADSG